MPIHIKEGIHLMRKDIEKKYKIGEFAEQVGVSVKTLQRWDKAGLLVAHRTVTNRRYYTEEQLMYCLNNF